MTDDLATSRRSRRALLAGAVAGAATLAAGRLASPLGVRAGVGPAAVMTETANVSGGDTSITSSSGAGFGALALADAPGVWGATNGATSAGVSGTAYAATGIGVRAANVNPSGRGLVVEGKVQLSRAGRATVKAHKTSVDVTVPGGLAGSPLLFANLITYRAGVAVACVRPNYPTAGKARIYLTKAVTADTKVSWLVVG